ncbi:MAG TPA: choice-of-anchor D domain-containing protein, partial [Candidatus Kapabacteria bacterium]
GAVSTGNIPRSFTPTSINNFEDILTVVIAPCNDTLTLVLKGEGGPIADLIVEDSLLVFGEVKAGDTAIICTKIINPSCIPVMLATTDLLLDGSLAFNLSDSSLLAFPVIISRDEPLTLCFTYAPGTEGEDTNRFVINAGGKLHTLKLHGTASSPHITHSTKVLDFGDVLLDSTKTLIDTITNTGKYPVFFTNDFSLDPVFSVRSIPSFLGQGIDSLLRVSFQPSSIAFYEDTVFMQWDNATDTIILRGRGTGHGALVSKTQLDFGDIRINTSRSEVVEITGGDGFPVILSNILIVGDTTFTASGLNMDTLLTSLDTASIMITYSPLFEIVESAQLTFDDNAGNRKSVILKGRGVEAHLMVDTTFIDFGKVKVGGKKIENIKVTDGGNFPLTIINARPTQSTVFGLNNLPQTPISPLKTENFEYVFTPTADVEYFDTVPITADAPEKEHIIVLRGEGTFGNIVYSVGDIVLNVGDIAEVPVSIAGIDLPSTTIDNFTCFIHYDPTVMFVHSVLSENTLSDGMTVFLERMPKDSLIKVHGFGKRLPNTPGVLFNLKTEALLGPVDTTRVVVVSSSPKHDSPQAAQGLYTVADCGKYRTNIHYKGPYSLSAPKPNPVTTTLSLSYELGLDGFVSIDIIDELGVVVKRVLADLQKRGKHSLIVNVNDLPSGMYTYILQSLEYRQAKSFILSK